MTIWVTNNKVFFNNRV